MHALYNVRTTRVYDFVERTHFCVIQIWSTLRIVLQKLVFFDGMFRSLLYYGRIYESTATTE